MKINSILFLACTFLNSQVSYTISNELKYGDGMAQSNIGGPTSYGYFENLLDINLYYNSVTLFTQWEYSDPPQFGIPNRKLNKGFLEHQGDNLRLVLGDIYTLYGRGLGINLFQDQTIDFDNSVRGVEFDYSDEERGFRLFGLSGRGEYWYKSPVNATGRFNDLLIDNSLYALGIGFSIPYIPGEFQFLNINQNSIFPEDENSGINERSLIVDMNDFSYSGSFLLGDLYLEHKEMEWNDEYNPLYDNEGNEINSTGTMKYGAFNTNVAGFGLTLEYKNYNVPDYDFSISNPPILYLESSSPLIGRNSHIINFNDEQGYQFELVRKIGNDMDIVFNISVANRNSGHYDLISLNHILDDSDDYLNPAWVVDSQSIITIENEPLSISDMISYKSDVNAFSFWPFRQLYTALFGYAFEGNLYYKLGIDLKNEIINYEPPEVYEIGTDIETIATDYWWGKWEENYFPQYGLDSVNAHNQFTIIYDDSVEGKIQSSIEKSDSLLMGTYNFEDQRAYTIPTQFSYSFGDGSSITTYIEHQNIKNTFNREIEYVTFTDDSNSLIEEIKNNYFTISYRSSERWSFTFIYDREQKSQNDNPFSDNEWYGVDFTMDVNDQNQFTLFYGSERGGLRCANGVCAYQPAFEDGFKVSLKTIF